MKTSQNPEVYQIDPLEADAGTSVSRGNWIPVEKSLFIK